MRQHFCFAALQSHYNCTSGLRKCISNGMKHLESPVADMEINTDVWLGLSGIQNLPSNCFKWGLPCSHLNWYCDYHHLQQKSDPSLWIQWLFTHQNAVSLDNTRLRAFFPPPGQQTAKPIIVSCLRLAAHHRNPPQRLSHKQTRLDHKDKSEL